MRVLGVDFETTGLDVKNDQIIEIGAVLWDTEKDLPLVIQSELLMPQSFAGLSDEVKQVTGITDEMIHEFGKDSRESLAALLVLSEKAEAWVAHNGTGFDKPIFESGCARYNLTNERAPQTWIDTLMDVPYPKHFKSKSLGYLAADHGFLNPFAHRAATDVLTMLRVLSNYPITQVVERAKSPNLRMIADVTFAQKDRARECGFYWDGEKKEWFKNIKEIDVDSEKALIGKKFSVSFEQPSLL